MSKEKGCKCCKQIWYVDMLDKKWKLCPNCYEYCKPLIDDLKIKDKKIADIQHRLKFKEQAEKELEQENLSLQEQSIRDNQNWIEETTQLKQSQKQLAIEQLEKVEEILWNSQDIGNVIDNDKFLEKLNYLIKSLKGEK